MAHDPEAALVLETADDLPGWRGSLAIYQEKAFAETLASLHGLEVVEVGDVLLLVSRRPVVKNMSAFVGSPKLSQPFARWWERIEALHCSQVEIQAAPPIAALERHRISAADSFSFVTDLRLGEEELWTRLGKNCRTAIRKGRSCGLEIRETQDEDDLRVFYDLLLTASEGGRRFSVASYQVLSGVLRAGFGRLFLALGRGRPVGGAFYLASTSLHAWFVCFLRDRMPETPGNALYWEAMRWGVARGLHFHDFGVQSLVAQPGLTPFKRSFTPFLVPAHAYRVPQSRLKLALGSLGNLLTASRLGN